jgi:hypothetical protein
MKLVAQRVVRPRDHASGINAYCYLHPGVTWLDEPPEGLGRGHLTGRMIELEPPAGNRVRSYLEITTPDTISDELVTRAVVSGAELLAANDEPLPWRFRLAETQFEFNLELALAPSWSVELRLLLAYALQVRTR